MTDLRKRNLLMEKLAAFGFSPLETEILAVLGEKTPQTIAEIQKKTHAVKLFREISPLEMSEKFT